MNKEKVFLLIILSVLLASNYIIPMDKAIGSEAQSKNASYKILNQDLKNFEEKVKNLTRSVNNRPFFSLILSCLAGFGASCGIALKAKNGSVSMASKWNFAAGLSALVSSTLLGQSIGSYIDKKIQARNNRKELREAAQKGDEKTFNFLVESGYQVDQSDRDILDQAFVSPAYYSAMKNKRI